MLSAEVTAVGGGGEPSPAGEAAANAAALPPNGEDEEVTEDDDVCGDRVCMPCGGMLNCCACPLGVGRLKRLYLARLVGEYFTC